MKIRGLLLTVAIGASLGYLIATGLDKVEAHERRQAAINADLSNATVVNGVSINKHGRKDR